MAAPHRIAADWLSWSADRFILDNAAAYRSDAKTMVGWIPHLRVDDSARPLARSPYDKSIGFLPNGRLLYSTKHAVRHVTIEIEGKGCQALEDAGHFDAVGWYALEHSKRITRFDLAVDIETDVMPIEFARKEMRGERWKSERINSSETGQTVYVGSQQSERYCRVYRWYPPHERAHLLRIEYVFKKPAAGDVLEQYLSSAPEDFAASCGAVYGWKHPVWDLSSDEPIKHWRPETANANQLRWLRRQVIPALQKAYDSGKMDRYHPIWAELAKVTPLEYTFLPPLPGTSPE